MKLHPSEMSKFIQNFEATMSLQSAWGVQKILGWGRAAYRVTNSPHWQRCGTLRSLHTAHHICTYFSYIPTLLLSWLLFNPSFCWFLLLIPFYFHLPLLLFLLLSRICIQWGTQHVISLIVTYTNISGNAAVQYRRPTPAAIAVAVTSSWRVGHSAHS